MFFCWQFGTFLGPSGHFWTISDKKSICFKVGFGGGAFDQQIIFCLKWSQRVQTGPKGSQMVKTSRFTISDPFGPLWTTLECWQAWHVWPFLFVLLLLFSGIPCNLTGVQVIPRFECFVVSNHLVWLDVTKHRELRSQLSYREMKTEFKGAYASCNSFRFILNSEWGVFQCWQLLCFILPSSYLQFGRRQVSLNLHL